MATNEKILTLNITLGGSREDIRDSLGSRAHRPFFVEFKTYPMNYHEVAYMKLGITVSDGTVYALIRGLDWEDGSGESFNIRGSLKIESDPDKERVFRFNGYYHTKRRSGTLNIILP
jgi:hypothetical protein